MKSCTPVIPFLHSTNIIDQAVSGKQGECWVTCMFPIGYADIDECIVVGICGEGGQCRNLDGSFDCSCQLGYQIHNGTEPFHPDKGQASCQGQIAFFKLVAIRLRVSIMIRCDQETWKCVSPNSVVDCGQPTSQNMVLLSATGTTFGSVATFECDEGFLWRSGNNTSICGADGLWRGLSMICEGNDPRAKEPIRNWFYCMQTLAFFVFDINSFTYDYDLCMLDKVVHEVGL